MSASNTDKITDTRNATRPNSARATGTRSAGGTSLACDNLAGWPVASKVHFVTYQLNSSSAQVAGTQLDCTGIVSGNTIGSISVIDGTDAGNSVNDVVEMVPTAAWGQDLADALTNQHTRTGTHTGITTDTLSSTGNVTVGGGLGVTGVLTPTGGLSAGSVNFAALLSTIFSGQIASGSNAGTAGGTTNFLNLGGVKVCWGATAALSLSSQSQVTGTVTFPTTYTAAPILLAQGLNETGTIGIAGRANAAPSTTGFTAEVISTTGGAQTGSILIHWIAIGT